MRCSWARGVSLSVLSVASVASAQRPPDRGESLVLALEPLILRTPREQPHLTIAGTFGALEHGTTGTLAAYGYDHVALGWHFGADLEVVFDKTLLGFGVDLRDLRGLDTDQARTFLLGANLRVGLDLGL